ncbi:L-methionine gamma-lyase-like isoform X2 [Corticium candelabrum]|nr:L-methionine gamma-lyase-like isoform X2 [Corticium candelabrum]
MIQHLEQAEGTLLLPSGMAAITTCLLTLLKTGDHVVAANVLYSGTTWSLRNTFARWGLEVSWVDGSSVEEYRKAIKPNTKLLYNETPANPLMGIVDLEVFGQLSVTNPDLITVVDSTFASPYLQQPIKYGVDIVVHSCTKYMGGHSDLTAGCISFRSQQLFQKVYHEAKTIGTLALSPFDAFLLHRGLKTLHIRMQKHSANALVLAQFLKSHPKVTRVYYPGLPSHPGHETAKKQMKQFGGMISFEVAGGLEAGKQLVEATRVFVLAVSLGGIESLIEHPASMTHTRAIITSEDQASANITDGLLRLSVGIEEVDVLKADLAQALDKVIVA